MAQGEENGGRGLVQALYDNSPDTTDAKIKKKKVSRIQRLKKHFNCGLGRLSISKEEIIAENENLNEVLKGNSKINNCPSMNTVCTQLSDILVDNPSTAEPNGNIVPDNMYSVPRTFSFLSHLDDSLRKIPTKCDTSLKDCESNRLRVPPPRAKSDIFWEATEKPRNTLSTANSLNFGKSESYVKLEQLGEGSYATVFKGYSNLTSRVVALKEIRLQPEEGTPFTAIREASLLRCLKHANIVTLHDIIHTKDSLTFVFEYLQTDLSQYLERHPKGINLKNVRLFLFQLLRGLAFCHERRVLHRDLKPQNLLLNEQGELKLADFGLARAKSVPSQTYSHEVVTLWYRPPDVLLGSTNYSTSLDAWGVGCILVEMVTGSAAFPGIKDTTDQLDKIWRILGTPSEESWEGVSRHPKFHSDKWPKYKSKPLSKSFPRIIETPYLENLAVSLLQVKPDDRISAENALHHEYFAELPSKVYQLPPEVSITTLPGCKPHKEASSGSLQSQKSSHRNRR